MILSKKLLLIVNPRAGKCKGEKELCELLKIFQCNDFLSTVLLTEKSGDACTFVAEYGTMHDLIVCIGGDGTFSEVVAGMIGGKVKKPVGYIPAGSTNDYGASLGLSSDIRDAAYDIVNGKTKHFDIGLYNDQPFSYVAAFGTFAKVSYSTPQELKNIWGHFAYILEGIRELPSLRPEHMQIVIDEEEIEGDFILGLISNTLSVGKILRFRPDEVDMNDGYLETTLISMPSSPKELSDTIQAICTQSYSDCSNIIFRRCREIRIHSKQGGYWTLDGEYASSCENTVIKGLHNAIELIVPCFPKS